MEVVILARKIKYIPHSRPDFNQDVSLLDLLRNIREENIPKLEREFANYIGAKHCCFANSGRSALYLVYKALKLEGEVIVPPLTSLAAIFPLLFCGLKPRFVDIDPQTFNMDPKKMKEAISKETVAIQPIHLAGNPCDMNTIKNIAEANKLLIIEDCAQSLGAEYLGKKIGGDIACFGFLKSFFFTGGMVASDDENVITTIRNCQQQLPRPATISLKDYLALVGIMRRARGGLLGSVWVKPPHFGIDPRRYREHFKRFLLQPNNIQALIARVQLKIANELLEKRISNASMLSEHLNGTNIDIQRGTEHAKHAWTRFMVKINEDNAADIIRKLRERGVEALHLSAESEIYQTRFDQDRLFSEFGLQNCQNYLEIHDHVVSLPLSSNMSEEEIIFVAEEFRRLVE